MKVLLMKQTTDREGWTSKKPIDSEYDVSLTIKHPTDVDAFKCIEPIDWYEHGWPSIKETPDDDGRVSKN